MSEQITAQYLNEKDVSAITGLSLSKLRNDRHRGVGMPYYKIGKVVRYRIQEVEKFMEIHRIVMDENE